MLVSKNGPTLAVDIEVDAFSKNVKPKMSLVDEIMHLNNSFATCSFCTSSIMDKSIHDGHNDKRTAKQLYDDGVITESEYKKLIAHEQLQSYQYEPGVSKLFPYPDPNAQVESLKQLTQSPEFYESIKCLMEEANEINKQVAYEHSQRLIDDREEIKRQYEKQLDQARQVITDLSGQIAILTKDNEEFADGLIEQEETIEKLQAKIFILEGKQNGNH